MSVEIADVKRWIHTNLSSIRTIDDIASEFSMSPETLRKRFVRHERTPLSVFVTRERVERAKCLLIDTHLRCFEVAYEAGFSREDVAARTFHRFTGETMEKYRKAHEIVQTNTREELRPLGACRRRK